MHLIYQHIFWHLTSCQTIPSLFLSWYISVLTHHWQLLTALWSSSFYHLADHFGNKTFPRGEQVILYNNLGVQVMLMIPSHKCAPPHEQMTFIKLKWAIDVGAVSSWVNQTWNTCPSKRHRKMFEVCLFRMKWPIYINLRYCILL